MKVKLAFGYEELNRIRLILENRCSDADRKAYALDAEDYDRSYWLYEHGEAVKLLRQFEAAAAQLTQLCAKGSARAYV